MVHIVVVHSYFEVHVSEYGNLRHVSQLGSVNSFPRSDRGKESTNHSDLEVEESGTWDDLSRAHRDLIAGIKTPSGHPNMYGKIPFRFPATATLDGLSPISDALVGRKRWTDPEVVLEVHTLLFTERRNDEHIKKYLSDWRARAAARVKKLFETTIALEKVSFKDSRSYFRSKDAKSTRPPPDEANVEPDSDEDEYLVEAPASE